MAQELAPLSPREQILLEQLKELSEIAEAVAKKQQNTEQTLNTREDELSALRRKLIEVKEENQHLREVLQTWRQRMDAVLDQLKSIN